MKPSGNSDSEVRVGDRIFFSFFIPYPTANDFLCFDSEKKLVGKILKAVRLLYKLPPPPPSRPPLPSSIFPDQKEI